MSPIAKLLFDILARDLVYFNGTRMMEFKPGSLRALAETIMAIDNPVKGGPIPPEKGVRG